MYRIDRNNFFAKPKNSTVYTPNEVSEFIFQILHPFFGKKSLVLDIGSGLGSLSEPWKKASYQTLGIDIDISSEADIKTDFLSLEKWEWKKPNLILCNPPFNGYYPKLAGEVFFDQIIRLFGSEIPLVIFFPYNFRLGVRNHSRRLSKFLTKYPAISSIISLPLDVYENVSFHSEILLFNISGLEPHYFFSFSTPNHYELKLKRAAKAKAPI